MAVVKASYFRGGAGSAAKLNGSVRYAATRSGDEGQERTAFSRDEDTLGRAEATETLEEAEGSYYYRVVLNSGEGQEVEADLKEWTRDTMGALAERHGAVAWVAYEHRDHSEHAHVHVVAATDKKLDKEDLQNLREAATESWARQEAWARETYRDDFGSRATSAQERTNESTYEHERGLEW